MAISRLKYVRLENKSILCIYIDVPPSQESSLSLHTYTHVDRMPVNVLYICAYTTVSAFFHIQARILINTSPLYAAIDLISPAFIFFKTTYIKLLCSCRIATCPWDSFNSFKSSVCIYVDVLPSQESSLSIHILVG